MLPPVLVPRYSEFPSGSTMPAFQSVPEPNMPHNVTYPFQQQHSPNPPSSGPGSPFGLPGKQPRLAKLQSCDNECLWGHLATHFKTVMLLPTSPTPIFFFSRELLCLLLDLSDCLKINYLGLFWALDLGPNFLSLLSRVKNLESLGEVLFCGGAGARIGCILTIVQTVATYQSVPRAVLDLCAI